MTDEVSNNEELASNAAAQDVRGGKPSASALHRLYKCPGSWQAEQQCPPEESSEAALMGTRLHKHMEDGTRPEDPEEAEACDWCRSMAEELAERCLGIGYTVFCKEQRWWAADGSFSGQPDLVLVSADCKKYLVLDYKFGRGAVDGAERNLQLAALAVLLADYVPDEIDEVYGAILQPYASRAVPTMVRYTAGQLAAARAAIAKAIARAHEENPALVPSASACKYCRAAESCPAAMRETLTLRAFTRWSLLPVDQRRALYDRSKAARKLCDKIDAAIRADLEAEVEIPGLVLGAGRTSFTVTDATAAFGVCESLGVTAQEFAGCCKVQISALDKVVHKHLKEKDAKQKVKDSAALLRNMLADAACGENKTSAGTIKEV